MITVDLTSSVPVQIQSIGGVSVDLILDIHQPILSQIHEYYEKRPWLGMQVYLMGTYIPIQPAERILDLFPTGCEQIPIFQIIRQQEIMPWFRRNKFLCALYSRKSPEIVAKARDLILSQSAQSGSIEYFLDVFLFPGPRKAGYTRRWHRLESYLNKLAKQNPDALELINNIWENGEFPIDRRDLPATWLDVCKIFAVIPTLPKKELLLLKDVYQIGALFPYHRFFANNPLYSSRPFSISEVSKILTQEPEIRRAYLRYVYRVAGSEHLVRTIR